MAKQLNVSLAFTADTGQAKAQIQDLQSQLTKLATLNKPNNTNGFMMTSELKEAAKAAQDLKNKLQAATDVNTGKLNLDTLSQSLSKSGKSLETYRKALSNLGPAGDQAFASLATSIQKAEVPLKTTNKLLDEFKTSLANTARWQLSSSMLHGFLGSLQSAFSYAQNLNKSLTDIQIVTGNSSDYMANFAGEANKAAQALSTTTKNYSDASLIFFQQGLNDDEVAKRTETTIKMAQATGDSVDQVSSYLTAIWNNFYDGSESLEHYADIITKLGAATASSSSEIAEGLQQFAGIGNTIGLSYDYATAALTTLTANTRQSATEIGNSLKTIFSRFQGVTLGDTLEDGVDLNKYSNALKKVGVDIIDVNGDMKDMDTILDETADHWGGLSRAQKMAFAETAAGTMQYTKLVSLMDHWDDMKQNLAFAQDADGTLDEQAEIYAESWEAAQKRVRAAWEAIWNDLINDDFFITLLNGAEDALHAIDDVIDSMGGLRGVIFLVGTALTTVFSQEIAGEINRLAGNIRIMTGAAKENSTQLKQDASTQIRKMTSDSVDSSTGEAMNTVYSTQANLQDQLIAKADQISAERKEELQGLLDINSALGQEVILAGKAADAAKRQVKNQQELLAGKMRRAGVAGANNELDNFTSRMESVGKLKANSSNVLESLEKTSEQIKSNVDEASKISLAPLESSFSRMKDAAMGIESQLNDESSTDLMATIEKAENMIKAGKDETGKWFKPSKKDLQEMITYLQHIQSLTDEANDNIMNKTPGTKKTRAAVEDLGDQAFLAGQQLEQASQQNDHYVESSENVSDSINDTAGSFADFGQKAVTVANTITTTIMVVTNLNSAISNLSNSDMSWGERITGLLGTILTMAPIVISNIVQIKTTFGGLSGLIGALKGGLLSLGSAIAGVVTTIAGTIGVALTVTAGLAALAATIAIVVAVANRPITLKEQLEEATEAANQAKQGLQDAKTAAQDLESAFSGYDSVLETLSSCTQGTQEWRDALLGVNESVIDILSNAPQLASMTNDAGESAIYRDENGALAIHDWAREQVTHDANQEKINAQAAVYQTDQNKRDLQEQQDYRDIVNKLYGEPIGDDFRNAVEDNVVDLKELVGKTTDEMVDYMKDNIKETDSFKNGNVSEEKLTTELPDVVETLSSSGILSDLKELQNTISVNAKTKDTENQALANMLIANNPELSKSKYADVLSESGGDVYKNAYNDAYKDALNNITDREGITGDTGTKNAIETMAKYASLTGLDKDDNYEVTDYKRNGDVEIQKTGDDGEATTDTIKAEVIASLVAASEATDKFTASLDALSDKISELESNKNKDGSEKSESQQKSDNAMASFLTSQDLLDATQSEIAALKEQMKNATAKDGTKGEGAFIDNMFGDGKDGKISDETAQKYGYETGQEMISAIQQAIQDQNDAWGDIGKGWMKTVQDAMDPEKGGLDLSELSVNEKKAIGDALNTAFKNEGSEGLEAAKNLLSDLPTDKVSEFANVITDIPFDSTTPSEFAKTLSDAGIETNATTEELQAFIDAMSGAGNATKDLTSQYAKNKEVIDKLSDGDIISADDFNKLDAEYQDYFARMLDGTYKLVGGAEALQQALKDDYTKAFQEQNKGLRDENSQIQNTIDSGNVDKLKTAGGTGQASDFDSSILQQQLDLLTAIGDQEVVNKGQIEEWQNSIKNGTDIQATLDGVQQALDATGVSETALNDLMAANEAQIHSTDLALLNSCDSVNQLNDAYREMQAQGDSISFEEYGQALQALAGNYDSCTEALNNYRAALNSGNEEKMNAAMYDLQVAAGAAENAEKYDMDAERIQLMADSYKDYVQTLKSVQSGEADAAEMATDLATRDLRLNEGIEDLYDNWDDYQDILDEVNRCGKENKDVIKKQIAASEDLSDTFASLRKNTAKLLNTNEDAFGDDFVIDNLDDIKAAAEGDEDALVRLQKAADKEIAIQLDDAGVTDILGQSADEIADWAANLPEGELKLQDEQYLQQLVWAMQMAGMAQDDIESKLSGMGIDVDLTPLDQSLNDAIASAGTTGDAMADNLSLDSTAVTQKVDASDTKQAVGWDATTDMVTAEGSVTNIKQTDKGGVEKLGDIPLKMSFPTVHVTPQKQEETEEKTLTAPALQVKSAHKTSGGNISHANSSGGRAARGGGGGGGGRRGGGGGRRGGGGGGGRAARRNSEQMKKPKDEVERYHTISKQLDSLTKQYDKVSKAKDRAYGTSKVKLMDQEIAKQKQIIAKQKEYLKAAKKNLAIDKKRLQNGKTKYTDSNGNQQTVASGAQNYLGKSALFDKNGNITNYEELMKAAVKKYNDAVKEFNQHTTDDEAAKARFEAAKQQYEGFTGWLKQYEETNELIADKAQDVIDAENELYDQRFEKTQYIMEIKIEVNDKKLEYLEYLLDKVDDSAHDAAEAIKLLGDTAQNALDERKINLQGLNDMFNNGNHKNLEGKGDLAKKMAAGDKKTIALLSKENFSDDEMKQIQDVMSNLLDINKKLREARQQVFEKMDDAFEDGVDKMDRLIDKQKHIQTMTESYGNIVDIVGKKSLGITSQMMKTYNANKVKQATDLLAESKTKMDSIQQQLDAAQAARDKAMKAGHKEDVKMWDESIKNMEDELQNAQEDFMSNWEDALQAARDAFDNNVDNMVDDFSTKVGGLTGSIAALQEKWDQNKTLEEQYVPQYEKIYQLTKLTRDINKSIDETKNVKAKRELASLQEEINGLQSDSKKMSEYDLEYLQKRYELKIAEMALEDAQNAKSQVRMTKDSEGNFSYVYTADEQQVAEAEQSYEDKLHEMQQMNAEYINTLQENMIKMEQEQAEKIAELSELYEVGSKEYQDALANLQKYYGEQLGYYGSQMNNVLSNNTDLYENDVKRYGELTDNKAMADEEYIGDFSQTQLSVATGYENMEDLQDNWNQAAKDMYSQVGQAADDYAAQNELAMEAAGTTMDDYANTMSNDVAQMTTDSDNLRTEMDDTAAQINSDFETVVESVKAFEDQYSASIDAIVQSNEELYESFLKVVQAHSQFKAVTSDNKGSDGDTNGGGNKGDTPKQPKQKKKKDNSDKAEGVAAAIWIWGDHSGWGDDPERARKLQEKGVSGAQAIINAKAENGWLYNKYWDKRFEVREKYSYGKFDTGGYTGDWSGEGRFAMLHQKEIVLNKDDTENFLKTVDIVRQISDMIDLNAMSASGGLGSLFAASVNKDNGVLEQNVHITAEFPNATNRDEILSAFDNVVNLASQYANRKR
jgi:hypothetical protein